MREIARALLDLLLPTACARCGARVAIGRALCDACDAHLPRLPADGCSRCQEAPAAAPGGRCPPCAARTSPLHATVAAVPFEGEVEDWIHRFKYPRTGLLGLDPRPRAVLTALARDAARRAPGPPPTWVAPVPLHPRRLRERGFNPAAVLARAIADEAGARFAPAALLRTRDTPSQTHLDRPGRARNVANAFRARRAAAGGTVWLVDDVVTTGATLAAAALALRAAGVRHVIGVCVARTLSSR